MRRYVVDVEEGKLGSRGGGQRPCAALPAGRGQRAGRDRYLRMEKRGPTLTAVLAQEKRRSPGSSLVRLR